MRGGERREGRGVEEEGLRNFWLWGMYAPDGESPDNSDLETFHWVK